jgi:hypothetical protein
MIPWVIGIFPPGDWLIHHREGEIPEEKSSDPSQDAPAQHATLAAVNPDNRIHDMPRTTKQRLFKKCETILDAIHSKTSIRVKRFIF